MNNRISHLLIFSFVLYLSGSCNKPQVNLKNGDVVIRGKDTFDVQIDTHVIVNSVRINPENILQESSPLWLNTTDKDSTFKSKERRDQGSIQVYQILKRRK